MEVTQRLCGYHLSQVTTHLSQVTTHFGHILAKIWGLKIEKRKKKYLVGQLDGQFSIIDTIHTATRSNINITAKVNDLTKDNKFWSIDLLSCSPTNCKEDMLYPYIYV